MRSTTKGVTINLGGTPQIRGQGRILIPVDPFQPQASMSYLETWFHTIRAVVEARLNAVPSNPSLLDEFGFAIELPDT
jgi:hypothetical protein